MQWYADPGISLELTKKDADKGCHQGPCDLSILALSRKPRIARQLAKLDPESVRDCLRGYGAWDSEELSDHAENLRRLLWLACCDIREGNCY